MNGPRPICAGCGCLTTLERPICDDCFEASGGTMTAYCALCEAGLAVDKFGQHTTKTGGYAGKCVAVQPV